MACTQQESVHSLTSQEKETMKTDKLPQDENNTSDSGLATEMVPQDLSNGNKRPAETCDQSNCKIMKKEGGGNIICKSCQVKIGLYETMNSMVSRVTKYNATTEREIEIMAESFQKKLNAMQAVTDPQLFQVLLNQILRHG